MKSKRKIPCPECEGFGEILNDDDKLVTCAFCGGDCEIGNDDEFCYETKIDKEMIRAEQD